MEKGVQVIFGSLLHDCGKVLYRHSGGERHSKSGQAFLKDRVGITDEEILNQVLYHHSDGLKGAKISTDSLAYITYIADNIASGVDRRSDEESGGGWKKNISLNSIFNLLNENRNKKNYAPGVIDSKGTMNLPIEQNLSFDQEIYGKIEDNLLDGLKGIKVEQAYQNSLLQLLEANLSFVPSSTSLKEVADISLFDHCKLTGAIASCILIYMESQGRKNYKEELYRKATNFYNEKAFTMCSFDLSGIQEFIYTVGSKNALKTLRARSFYLEILAEHIADELLVRLGLSRANLLYTGGGHGYLLLPSSNEIEEKLTQFIDELKEWCIDSFDIGLYVAWGRVNCSASALMNKDEGSYKEIFTTLSHSLSENKMNRYLGKEIEALNDQGGVKGRRECKVCRRVDRLLEEDICSFCEAFVQLSANIVKKDFAVILDAGEVGVPLPFGAIIRLENREETRQLIQSNASYRRAYSKNDLYTGEAFSTKLWVGDYKYGNDFASLAAAASGVKRLGVLRGDVDNLGQTFVSGFERKEDGDKYVSISRTATFSRKLSMFFKLRINDILEKGEFSLSGERAPIKRDAMIVYSGGDDVFLVGSWNHVVEIAVDLNHRLKEYSDNTLSISVGVGIFSPKYPVALLARQTGDLEAYSKKLEGKDAITLFDQENRYSWEQFEQNVVNEKLRTLQAFLDNNEQQGFNFLYRIMDLVRHSDENINLARLAYTLARMEPTERAQKDEQEKFDSFSRQLYQWVCRGKEDRRELLTAIYLYVYLNREQEAIGDGTN